MTFTFGGFMDELTHSIVGPIFAPLLPSFSVGSKVHKGPVQSTTPVDKRGGGLNTVKPVASTLLPGTQTINLETPSRPEYIENQNINQTHPLKTNYEMLSIVGGVTLLLIVIMRNRS